MNYADWKWLNESRIVNVNGEVAIAAPAKTDWFNNPVPVNGVFCTHYSLDGERFDMVRLFHLPAGETVKVGLEAQSPVGEGGLRFFSDVSLEYRTVENLRKGI